MARQRKIYVIGHKNPDTDSICSAIAYADIKNRMNTGHRYAAKRAGQINEETEYVLKRFGVEAPGYLSDVGTQVKDMEIRETPGVSSSISIKDAWAIMKESSAVTLPITREDGQLEGLITTGDIAKSYMDAHDNYFLSNARTQYRSIANTVEGKVVTGNPHGYFMKGKVVIGAAHPDKLGELLEEDDLAILGDRYEDHKCAIEQNVSCMIVCNHAEVSEDIKKAAEQNECVIIQSSLDTFSVARLINQSIPVKHIMKKDNLITFQTDDFTDNIKDIMVKNRHRAFPVVNKHGKYIGTVSRRNLLGMKKKQLILVDHNEKSQAVDNIDAAEILEIVDHHRLGSLETLQPIMFRNQPVGCTATILYQMYVERGLEIKPQIAGLLCAAIVSDTLMFRSPTCTAADKMAAGALALMAGIHIEEFAKEMFTAGSNLKGKTTEVIFYQDFKRFTSDKVNFGVGQISSMDAQELHDLKKRLIPFMKHEYGKNGISMVFFMLTNILEESSEIICFGEGSGRLVEESFEAREEDGGYILPGVVSRKKQLIPAFIGTLQQNNN
ncbi:MAG TPA: putative manganese-dependent inorganic diphosphatase [Candidatus Blautia pullicola]|mgnify:CR=1 FL=1|jgi:manganese-dependent inorganic pyrophosphatase|uniref:inorganic diphosphatase n=1 Tax=Candidatus Blautia pullicola TaxID=2838498 RepID=A0A9D2FP67_9FIRM|nr:putative manganese-dependent inorganic diphosphatase [Candidatus Blautia pullicola]